MSWPEDLLVDGEYVLDGEYSLAGAITIAADEVVRVKAGSQLHVDADVIFTIADGGQFIVEAGATVTFDTKSRIDVRGEWLIAQGTTIQSGSGVQFNIYGVLTTAGVEGSEVIFTSSLDIPEKGSWNGIHAYNGSNVTLRYTQVKYASMGIYEVSISSATYLDIQYSLFEQNKQAINIYESTRDSGFISTIHYNSFVDNSTNLYTSGRYDSTIIDARYNWWGTSVISEIMAKIYDRQDSTQFLLVNYGAYRRSIAWDDVFTNSIAVSWPEDLLVDGEYVLDGEFSIIGYTELLDGQTLRIKSGSKLYLSANLVFKINLGAQIVVEEGAEIIIGDNARFDVYGYWSLAQGATVYAGSNSAIYLYGQLEALGSDTSMVRFISLTDNAEADYWQGIKVFAGSNISLNYTHVSHAKYAVWLYQNEGVSIQASLLYSHFTHNKVGVYIEDRSASVDVNVALRYGSLENNVDYNVYTYRYSTYLNSVIDLRFNWWGSADIDLIADSIYDHNDHANGLLVNYTSIRQSIDVDDILYVFTEEIDTSVVVKKSVLISNTTTINESVSLTLAANANMVLAEGAVLKVNGDLIIEEGATISIDESATLEVTGRIVVKSSDFNLPQGLVTRLSAGAQLRAAIGTRINLYGEFYSEGTAENPAIIGSEESSTGFWYGIHAHSGSKLIFNYTRITQAEIGVYVAVGSNVTITHSWLVANQTAIKFFDDSDNSNPLLLVNYNIFEENINFNIDAQQTVEGYFVGDIDARFNWWGSADVATINRLIYDRKNNNTLGLLVDFSQPWLDATGSIVWSTAFVGNIDSSIIINGKLSIIGYSLLSSDFTVSATQQLIIESSASMYITGGLSIAKLGKLVLRKGAYLGVAENATITMNANTDIEIGISAKIEIFGELIARAESAQPIVFVGAQPIHCETQNNSVLLEAISESNN